MYRILLPTILAVIAAIAYTFGIPAAYAADAVQAVEAAPAPILDHIYNWSGFYAGLNAGWGSIRDHGSAYCINPAGVRNGTGCETTNVPDPHVHGSGFIGGIQAGYNWQSSNIVYGVETDFQGTSIKGSLNIAGPFGDVGGGAGGAQSFNASAKLRWLGTTRGRIGYAWDRVMLYATGGVAYGGARVSQDTVYTGVDYPSATSKTKAGWVAGGGVEWAFADNWSTKLEGLYYDLGKVSTEGGSVPPVDTYRGGKEFNLRGAIVRVGLNYKF